MSIPMRYQTSYRGSGEGEAGVIHVEGHDELPVGSPHDPDRYSPEHLMVAALETCLANYISIIARMSKLDLKAYRSSAEGELEQEQKAGYRFKRFVVCPELTVPEGSESLAERVIDKAHRSCLVSRSLNCPVEIRPVIRT